MVSNHATGVLGIPHKNDRRGLRAVLRSKGNIHTYSLRLPEKDAQSREKTLIQTEGVSIASKFS